MDTLCKFRGFSLRFFGRAWRDGVDVYKSYSDLAKVNGVAVWIGPLRFGFGEMA